VACRLGFTPAECAEDHWARALHARKEANHWRARCPVCGRDRALEITPKRTRVWWNCHTAPACDHAALRAELDTLIPCRAMTPAQQRHREASARESAMRELILDREITDNARCLGLLQVLDGLGAADAAVKLGMPRSTYYRALAALTRRGHGQHRTGRYR
jgi:hypothetical protein